MGIIVPPELTSLMANANHATIQKAAAQAVKDSIPGGAHPPKFGSKVGQVRRKTAAGFRAEETGELAKGAEFGGRRKGKVTYAMSRGGSTFPVTRRTTQQFLPFNPRGYALTPATRRSMAGIRRRISESVMRAVTR